MDARQQREIRRIARRSRTALFGVGSLTDDLKAQWDDAIAQYQQTRQDLDQAESDLYAVQMDAYNSPDPQDWEEWQSAFSKVNAAKSTMDAIADAVQTAVSYWNTATDWVGGLFGVSRRQGIAGALGLLPAIPITLGGLLAVIAGGAAAVTAAYAFIAYINAKTSKYQQYVDSGMPQDQAAEQARKDAQQESGYTFGARIERIVFYVALGAVALIVLPKVMNR